VGEKEKKKLARRNVNEQQGRRGKERKVLEKAWRVTGPF